MDICSTEQLIIENDNLLSFIIDTFEDKKSLGSNIRLLRECLFEWHNTNIQIEQNDKIHPRNVGPALRVWDYDSPTVTY